jgi:hypothetical protein
MYIHSIMNPDRLCDEVYCKVRYIYILRIFYTYLLK